MGMGCTRVVERVCAATGQLEAAPTRFEAAVDVPQGGVLWAMPALLENGLLQETPSFFSLPKGFYHLLHIFILLAYMALCRIKTPEQLRYHPAGEGGKLLGLDRIPEVRTLREKIKILAEPDSVKKWSAQLSQAWMEADTEAAGVLFVDGHVRVYHGSQTPLPKRFVSRQRLCLRGTTDYWVNDQHGRPFFVISTAFTEGLLDMLQREIIPRLIREVPNQPSPEELQANPDLHRFTLVFDREGYSPKFFAQMWKERIACQTYRKYPGENWPTTEFEEMTVLMPGSHRILMRLAERKVNLGEKIEVREIRKLAETGHQTAIISTDYTSSRTAVAAHMFARWSQENFFRYMMHHFDIDKLIDYETSKPDETRNVVNPAYRALEGQIKSKSGQLSRKLAEFRTLTKKENPDLADMTVYEYQKGNLQEQIDFLEKEILELKTKRKETTKHIPWIDLPEELQFQQLAPERKLLMDTIRMIAYRAETAMVMILREKMARPDDARSLAREIFVSTADLIPDEQAGTLTVKLHHLTNHASDEAVRHLAQYLNASETIYPGTNLRLIYQFVSDHFPPD